MEHRKISAVEDILEPNIRPRWSEIGGELARTFPFHTIASIRFWISLPSTSGPYFTGTGWFIAPNAVVTAAHVMDIRPLAQRLQADRWHIEIVPGLAANNVRPVGSFFASGLTVHPNWDGAAASAFDLAVIRLDRPVFGPNSCLRPATLSNIELSSVAVRVLGYPGLLRGDIMVMHEGSVGMVEGHQVFYAVDTEDGQSGGPVLARVAQGSGPVVVAIHAGGRGFGVTPLAQSLNVGLWMRPDLLQWIGQAIIG